MEIAELDEQIDALRTWILRAGRALISFYHEDTGTFWEGTIIRDDDSAEKIHPTATNRAFFALYQYLRFIEEENISIEDLQDIEIRSASKVKQNESSEKVPCMPKEEPKEQVTCILREIAEKYLGLMLTCPDKARDSPYNKENMLTDSHLLMSIALLRGIKLNKSVDVTAVEKAAREEVFEPNVRSLLKSHGGKVHKQDGEKHGIHDFVTLHAVRAFDAFDCGWDNVETEAKEVSKLRTRIEEEVLRQLAFYFADVSSRFDPTYLALTISLLNRFSTTDVLDLTRRSVETIAKSQTADGGWPTPLYMTSKGGAWLQIASYEVALTLTDLLLRYLYTNNDDTICDAVLQALARAFGLVKSSYKIEWRTSNKITGVAQECYGWANDHTRQEGLIESWVTATVLIFLIHYHDALYLLRQTAVLKRYRSTLTLPRRQVRFDAWPDLTPSLDERPFPSLQEEGSNAKEERSCVDWEKISVFSDPTTLQTSDSNPITPQTFDVRTLTGLLKTVLKTIESSWIRRPNKSFLLFYGEPMTGKTTLVEAVAEALHWPYLLISPPNFLRNGLEGFEASSAAIFDDLLRLRRVVILFDECEDFFKRRDPAQKLESRTIGAFITSGMLPRLQRLHKKNWVIFVLATNSTLAALDEAATREGRFDHTLEVKHPDGVAQVKYIKEQLSKKRVGVNCDKSINENTISAVERAIRLVASAPKAPRIPFKVLNDFVDMVVAEVTPEGKELTDKQASELLKKFMGKNRWFQSQSA
ncbi:MAG TPA: ATP-binding protein [Chloroflexia bacterium]